MVVVVVVAVVFVVVIFVVCVVVVVVVVVASLVPFWFRFCYSWIRCLRPFNVRSSLIVI